MGWRMHVMTRDMVPDEDHWRHDYTPEMYGDTNRYDHDRKRWHWSIVQIIDGRPRTTLAGVVGTKEEAMAHADRIGGWYESQFQRAAERLLVESGSRDLARGGALGPVCA